MKKLVFLLCALILHASYAVAEEENKEEEEKVDEENKEEEETIDIMKERILQQCLSYFF